MDIDTVKNSLTQELIAVRSVTDLEALRAKYLGRKGILAELTGSIPSLPQEERGAFGKKVNDLKAWIISIFEENKRHWVKMPLLPQHRCLIWACLA